MQETKYIWKNGKFIAWAKATTHILSHGLQYGTGFFEGIRSYPTPEGETIFRLQPHVERIFHSAQALGMKLPWNKKQIAEAIIATARKNKVSDCYIRPYAFYGYQKVGPNPADSPVDMIIACIPLKDYLKRDFIKVTLAPLARIAPSSAPHGTKISGMYYHAALSGLYAWKRGFDEAIVLDHKGYVAEGAAENLYMVKHGKIYTPPADTILPGITRDTLMTLCKDMGIPIQEKRLTLKMLQDADEVFFSGTAVELHSIGQIEKKKLPRKNPITKELCAHYMDVVHGKVGKYKRWLTWI